MPTIVSEIGVRGVERNGAKTKPRIADLALVCGDGWCEPGCCEPGCCMGATEQITSTRKSNAVALYGGCCADGSRETQSARF